MNGNPPNNPEPSNRFAQSDEEAAHRFEGYKSQDPFPEIPPALLNWADIEDYVAATGMICPFYPDPEKSKPASYEVNLLGKYVYWDEEGKKQVKDLKRGGEFILKRNSIAFVTLEPMLRIPDYIALRFNLKITHVYRGILLGTGPLVDPGYKNKLSMPLHNLTTNDYTFRGGEPLIWMEFTKLSPIQYQQPENEQDGSPSRQGKYRGFPQRKNELSDVEDYLRKADPHRPIRSSIPAAIQDAERAAKRANNLIRIGSVIGLVSIVGLAIGLYGSFSQVASLVAGTNAYVNNAREELGGFQRRFDEDSQSQANQRDEVQSLKREMQDLKKRLDDLAAASASFGARAASPETGKAKNAKRNR